MRRFPIFLCLIAFACVFPSSVFAFPDQERIGVGGRSPPFDFGFNDTLTGFILKDDGTMLASYGETLAIVDLGFFALAAGEPPPLSVDSKTDGRLSSIAYSKDRDRVYAPQEDGDCLVYDITKITEDPTSVLIAEGNELGPIALDNNSQRAYIVNRKDNSVNVLNLGSLTVDTIITLTIPSITTFNINSAAHDTLTDEIYFMTDKGVVFYIPAGGTTGTVITIDATNAANLQSAAATPNGSFVYVTDETDNTVVKLDASAHSVSATIDLTENPAPTGIVITEVSRPQGGGGNATYAYVAGSKGISVINMANDVVLDMGTDPHDPMPMSVVAHNIAASSVADGYVYTGNATQTVGVVSANPWVTISSLTYSGGGSTMGVHESFTLAFQADETGTATIKSGGDVTGSGTALVDGTGASSWDIPTAATDVTVQINYDDNSTSFIEGANSVFVFATDADGNSGRIAVAVNVDTPPPAVTMRSAGFGTSRIYVTFDRIDVADLNHYNVYVDTDPAAVLTKAEVAATASQASSGSTQEAQVDGLENGIVYYIAMEAVDNAGNISPSRTNTFADGSIAYGIPQQTGGPCEFSGEKGCTLAPLSKRGRKAPWGPRPFTGDGGIFVIVFLLIIVFMVSLRALRRAQGERDASRRARNDILGAIVFFIIIFSSSAASAKEPSPQWWSLEVKTGFWMPRANNVKHFFGDCCNLITRVQGGLLAHGRYGAEAGVGFFIKNATAAGTITGEESRDSFNFIMIPLETNFVWRVDYWAWDYFLPYLKAGLDYVIFRENLQGDTTKGVKFGMHAVLGTQLNLKMIDESAIKSMDDDFGINDMFLTLEAQYQYINNFGGKGLNLSGPVFSIGLLFEF